MSRTPSLYEVVKAGIDSTLDDLHTAMPGIVESYDASKQLAKVTPAIQRRYLREDGTEATRNFPTLSNVPVCFPRAGDFFISLPIKKGDFVLLIFSERSIDQWLEKGDIQDPIVTTKHDLSDAVAIAGVYPSPKKLNNAHADHLTIGHDGSGPRAYFKNNEIALGAENPSEFVALATKTKNEITALRNSFNDFINNNWTSHQHPSGMGPTGPPIPAPPVIPPATVNDIAASKVKAE